MKIKLIETMETNYENYDYKYNELNLLNDIKENKYVRISKGEHTILLNSDYIMSIEV